LGGGVVGTEQPAQPAAEQPYTNMSKSQRKRMAKLEELREKKKHRSAALANIGCVRPRAIPHRHPLNAVRT